MPEYFTPHFRHYAFPIEIPMSPKGLMTYLSLWDSNFESNNLHETIDFGESFRLGTYSNEIHILNQLGQGLISDGQLPDTLISEGWNALNRRGFYKIVGDLEVVQREDTKGKVITWIKAATLYTEGRGKRVFINIMNVSPLVNLYGFGFNLTEVSELRSYNAPTFSENKYDFLKKLTNKVIYISEQYWQPVPDEDYDLKHTVWFQLPKSMEKYLLIENHHIRNGDHVMFNRIQPHMGRY